MKTAVFEYSLKCLMKTHLSAKFLEIISKDKYNLIFCACTLFEEVARNLTKGKSNHKKILIPVCEI
jgi:hypothetical protein